jgi:hypothetical protein
MACVNANKAKAKKEIDRLKLLADRAFYQDKLSKDYFLHLLDWVKYYDEFFPILNLRYTHHLLDSAQDVYQILSHFKNVLFSEQKINYVKMGQTEESKILQTIPQIGTNILLIMKNFLNEQNLKGLNTGQLYEHLFYWVESILILTKNFISMKEKISEKDLDVEFLSELRKTLNGDEIGEIWKVVSKTDYFLQAENDDLKVVIKFFVEFSTLYAQIFEFLKKNELVNTLQNFLNGKYFGHYFSELERFISKSSIGKDQKLLLLEHLVSVNNFYLELPKHTYNKEFTNLFRHHLIFIFRINDTDFQNGHSILKKIIPTVMEMFKYTHDTIEIKK